MAKSEKTLHLLLTALPSRQLYARLAKHRLAIASSRPKAELIEQLHTHLTQPPILATMITQVDDFAKDALRALLNAQGALPVHPFEQRFGPLRPYHPWRQAEANNLLQPWLSPISATETLWYLGLLFRNPPKPTPGQVQHYVIPADLIPLLTDLLRQPGVTTPTTTVPPPGHHGPLAHHLAIWLATIHAPHPGPPYQSQAVKPVHQRWLPPSVVVLLCQRLVLDQDPAFQPIRTERHLPYLAFLHYLALAADLVTVTPAGFQLTPTAWAWLNAPTAARHQQLVDAWRTAPLDLAHRFGFRWEPLPVQARALVMAHLPPPGDNPPMALIALVNQWRLLDSTALLPTPRPADWRDEATTYDPLHHLLTGPLHWLGLVTLHSPQSAVQSPESAVQSQQLDRSHYATQDYATQDYGPSSSCTMPKQPANTIHAPLNVQPLHLVRLARFCDWTITPPPTPTPHTFTLAPARIAQLAAQGIAPDQLLEHLTAALGRPPSRRTSQRLYHWAEAGQHLRLRTLLVLEADTPERLAQLRRHKLVRNRLGETIAPNRITLRPTDADALAQTLRTLGYYVEPPASLPSLPEREPLGREGNDGNDNPSSPATPPAPELAEGVAGVEGATASLSPLLQWFLITLYQGLGHALPLPIDLPWAIRQSLRDQLTALQQAEAEGAAHQLLTRFQAALAGYLQLPARTMPPTAEPEPIIQRALADGHDLEIRYWGPADGQITTRTVTPYWIEEHHQIRYLIGWCHLRQQERTFRLDRIEAVVLSPKP
jgi:hypothetical protein